MSESQNNTISLSTSAKVHDLAMLYLKNQKLADLTPEQLAGKYVIASKEISTTVNQLSKANQ